LWPFANDTNDTVYSTNYLPTMTNVPFGEMLESCGSVKASFPAFSAAIGAEEPHQWTVVSLKDLKGDIETVMRNPVKAKLIRSTAGKHVYALRTWLENTESRDQESATADFDSTKTTRLIIVCGWMAIEGKAATYDHVGSTVPTLKIAADW
jgi:hypothetical protein